MNLSQITLAARIFEILSRTPKSLEVYLINRILANERWRGNKWYAGGVSRQRITQLLCTMRARGLARRTSSGWRATRNIFEVTDLRGFITILEGSQLRGNFKHKIARSKRGVRLI